MSLDSARFGRYLFLRIFIILFRINGALSVVFGILLGMYVALVEWKTEFRVAIGMSVIVGSVNVGLILFAIAEVIVWMLDVEEHLRELRKRR